MSNTWLIRSEFDQDPSKKTGKYSVMDSFSQENIIAIDYPLITESLAGKSREELMALLKTYYSHFSERQFLLHLNTLHRMAQEACIGDHIVVTDGTNVHFGKIESDYRYDIDGNAPALAHQRQVTWLKGPIPKKALPKKISDSLRAPISFSSFSHLTDNVIAYLNNKKFNDNNKNDNNSDNSKANDNANNKPEPKQAPVAAIAEDNNNLRTFTYPVRLDLQAAVQIPGDINKDEASRLADFVRTLYFK